VNLLLIEDDPVLARGIQINLETEGYQVFLANSLRTAFAINENEKLSLVLLDLSLGDGSGIDFLIKVRESQSRLPIIVLTARTDEESVVEALQRGANDYMKKPFGNKELVARIKAVLREPQMRETQTRFGDLLLLIDQRIVMHKGKTVEMNRREFDILLLLVQRANTIVSRENILQILDKDGEIFDRTIDSHVSHLRSKFRSCEIADLKISSVYGVGYRLERV
jgi:two-component system OmpR family response regulator